MTTASSFGSHSPLPKRAARAWLLGLGAAATIAATPVSAAEPCAPLFEAMHRFMMSASHSYTTETSDIRSTPTLSETIYVNNDAYVLARGKWSHSPTTLAEIWKAREAQMAADKPVCKLLRDEKAEGVDAMVLSEHVVSEAATVDSTIWIAKASGLPLKVEIDMNVGGVKGKTHISTRLSYSNVAPPPGVK